MFKKREDGLERVLWPYMILGALAAIPCAWAANCRGWALAAAYIGFWALWTLALLLGWVIFVFLLSLTVDMEKPEREDHPVYRRIVLSIIGLLCRIGRLRIHLRGWEDLPKGRFLLVGNHRSNYDPIATIWALRQKGVDIAFVTKPENMRIPLVRIIHKINYLVIDREDPRKALETIGEAADLLVRDVVNVGIYPEGTRSRGTQMLPFHNAVFKIAKRAGVPIVVAAISGTERIHENVPWRHTDITVDLCAVLSREEVAASSTRQLGECVRELLEQAAGVCEAAR